MQNCFSHELRNISELKTISKLWEKNFKDFFDKNVFPDNIFFKEFFIAFKTITLYKRDMYVFHCKNPEMYKFHCFHAHYTLLK